VVWTIGTTAAGAAGSLGRGVWWDEVVAVVVGSFTWSWCVGLLWNRVWSNHQRSTTTRMHKPPSVDTIFHFDQSRV
jgi:hypothetical protein